jgi:hypothetical protein
VALHAVGTDADNNGPSFVKIVFCVAKLARFARSPGRIVPGIKPQHDLFAAKILQLNLLTIGIDERKTRCGLADCDHYILLAVF